MKSKRLTNLIACVVFCFVSVNTIAETLDPIYKSEIFLGGAGNQYVFGLTTTENSLFLGGSWLSTGQNKFLKYSLPLTNVPDWAFEWPGLGIGEEYCYDVAVTDTGVYFVGGTYILASDHIGSKECKSIVVKFPLSGATGGGLGGCEWHATPHFFPSYQGAEFFCDVESTFEDDVIFIYIAGQAQTNGGNYTAILTKYDSSGQQIWFRNLSNTGYGHITSVYKGMVLLNGNIYVAASDMPGWGVEAGSIGYIWGRDAEGSELPTIQYQEAGKGILFYSLTTDGEYLYVAGHINPGPLGNKDILLMKYKTDGTLLWKTTWGGPENEKCEKLVIKDGFLYAAGSTTSFGSGMSDLILLKVNTQDGCVNYSTMRGWDRDEWGRDMVILDQSLFIAATTTSTSANGNSLGENEVMLLSFLLPECTIKPVADITGDCRVDMADFAEMASDWLRCTLDPIEACNY